MGTRNLTLCIDKKGEVKVAQYGQWDGYPSGVGLGVLAFVNDKNKMIKLEEKLDNIRFYNGDNTSKEIKDYFKKLFERQPRYDFKNKTATPDLSTEQDRWYLNTFLSRDLSEDVFDNIINTNIDTDLPAELDNTIYLYNDIDFAKDSLMCEWAYAINFQTNKLMCFEGFNKDKSDEYELFTTTQEEIDKQYEGQDCKYYGMKLIKEYDLDNLPTNSDFIKNLEGDE